MQNLFSTPNAVADLPVLSQPVVSNVLDPGERTLHLVFGERKLRTLAPAMRELRLRCGQQDDLTTDPEYFTAANTMQGRKVAAVLIRHHLELEACVLLIEYCRFGMGLGIFRGGNPAGDGLVIGPQVLHLHYVHLAAEFLLLNRRNFAISLAMRADVDQCIEVMGPESRHRMFCARGMLHLLPLASTYSATLANMGSRTRRSLAGKRQKLETEAKVVFLPSLAPPQALEAMLQLQPNSLPVRKTGFYHARYHLLKQKPHFFNMGLLHPDGTWLSILSGWRRDGVTYVDLQMNNKHFKKESLSAVMRAFMLEHEITNKQAFIYFVGGTSLLLRRYCLPTEPTSEAFLQRPGVRARIFEWMKPYMDPDSIYWRVKQRFDDQAGACRGGPGGRQAP